MIDVSAESGCERSSRLICFSISSLRLRRDLLLVDLLAVVLDLLGELFAFAELRLDRLELLAQEVLALRLVHLALRGGGDLLLHGQQVDLARQELVDAA